MSVIEPLTSSKKAYRMFTIQKIPRRVTEQEFSITVEIPRFSDLDEELFQFIEEFETVATS